MTEQQFEMMDDYLSNRLSADDKSAFEQQVQADPQLAQELDIQKNLVEGIRQARAVELKSMLNNVPVSPINGGSSMLMKVGTWAVVAGLVVTGIYFYSTNNEEAGAGEPKIISEQTPEVKPEVAEVPETESEPATEKKEEPSTTSKKAEEKVKKSDPQPEKTEPAPAKPLDVYEPSEEVDEKTKQYEREQMENIKKAFVTSSIEVETDTMSKKYNFHYVFKNNKLILYGAFEKNLYEILEFIGDEKRTVALFYKSNYYLLDIEKTQPVKLTPIRDQKLLKMLQAHRSK
jgi:hypothetical protein